MSDSIKFGPEWLRNMSSDTGSLSSSTSGTGGGGGGLSTYPNSQSARFPLAEYRYGREEMLSLYDKNFKLPELLPKFNKLFIEKMQCPLALLPPSADEEAPPRGLTPIGGLPSERSGLGVSANSSSGSVLGGISSTLSMSGRGIRGSSIDRGRGRASRGGLYHTSLGSYQRSGFVYDDDSRGIGARGERSWTERNGNEADWNSTANGSPSPRKDFSTLRSGGSGESWRRSREEEGQPINGTNEGWRNSTSTSTNSMYKWPVRSTSWRGGENDPNAGGSAFNPDGTGPPRLERSKSTQGNLAGRDHPPDSAAHNNRRFAGNASWDEDNLPEWAMDEPIEGGGSFDATGAFLGADDRHIGDKTKVSDTSQVNVQTHAAEKCDKEKPSDATNMSTASEKEATANDASGNVRTNNEKEEISKSNVTNEPPHETALKTEPNSIKRDKELKANVTDVKKASDEKTMMNKQQVTGNTSYKNTSKFSGPDAREKSNAIAQAEKLANKTNVDDTPIDRLQEDIEKLIMDDDQSCNDADKADDVHAEKPKETDRWYYRDPQGVIQGAFTATAMLEWYRAGYFDNTLHVRRVCDPQFMELGELLKAYSGSIPFVSMPPIIPPLHQSNANDITMSAAPNVKSSTPTKPLANHLVHTGKMPPPSSANNPPFYDIMQTQNFLGLMNPPSNDFLLSNSLPKHQNPAINPLQNPLQNPLTKQTHLKNQHQTQSLQHLLSQHKNDFNAPDQVDPMHHMLNSLNHQQISPPVGILPSVPPVPTIPPQNTSQNNSFQSLIMQLRMQKPHIMQQQIQQHHQQSIIMNAMNTPSLPLPHHSIDEIQHQPAGIWDLPVPPAGVGAPPPVVPSSSMKTEMQIIEHFQAQAQAQAKAKEEQFKVEHLSAQQIEQWKKQQQQQQHQHQQQQQQQQHQQQQQQQHQQQHQQQQQQHQQQQHQHQQQQKQQQQQQQALHQAPSQQMQHHQDVQQIVAAPQVVGTTAVDTSKPNDMFRPKNDNVKEIEANRSAGNKVARPRTDVAKPIVSDPNAIQNINKLNNNATETLNDSFEKKAATVLKTNLILKRPVKVGETVTQPQPVSTVAIASDVANKTNNNLATATAPKNATKESTKKKSKEKDQKAAEEKRRQLEEEEERKRLELIAAQRKAKLIDQNAPRAEQAPKRNNLAASVAPWSNIAENAASTAANTSLTLAEIQKAERERRAEQYRTELAQQQTQSLLDQQQQQKEAVLKWKVKPPQNQAKSLAEIQAEESKARQTIQQNSAANAAQKQQTSKKDEKWSAVSQWSMIWGNEQTNNSAANAAMQSGNGNAITFWEDPAKATTSTKVVNVQQNGTGKALAKSQTVSNMQSVANNAKATTPNPSKSTTSIAKTNSTGNVTAVVNSTANSSSKKPKTGPSTAKKPDADDEFGAWCAKALTAHNDVIDVPTFVSFLRDIESPFEVKDYIRMYLGETKECGEFAKHFLERRSKYKNQQRAANAHIDDMCSPAPAITPAADGQESKGKAKKDKKKSKMTKLDSRILGFSVTSAEDRLNVGARDYARDGP